MPIFQVTATELKALAATSFGAESIMERKDIQRLLREQISVLDEGLMVIAEEFVDWLDSSRRIDLLCIDSDANLVVVELKRTDDGGHMELQALRYAAMISAMTFEQLVETFARYRSRAQPDLETARSAIMAFLGWNEIEDEHFAQDTRIILAAADFSKELTTSVMWLREYSIDIRCVRMKPYRMADGTVLLDVQQLIPLPEAADFQTQIGVKKQAERQNRTDRYNLRMKFWEGLLEHAKTQSDVHANRKPTQDNWITGSIGRAGFQLNYVVRRSDSQVELWIGLGSGQAAKGRMGNRGKKEFIQILRLMEVFEEAIVAAAVVDAMQLGAIGFDAVKQLVLARIERRPARLDLARYPYLPAAEVKTTAAADYAALLSRSAA